MELTLEIFEPRPPEDMEMPRGTRTSAPY